MRRRLLIPTLVAGLAAALAVGTTLAYGSEPPRDVPVDPGPSATKFVSDTPAFAATQERLDAAAATIKEYDEADSTSGYGSLVVDALNNVLNVYWKGQPSGPAQAILDDLRTNGTNVLLLPANYTHRELQSAAQSFLAAAEKADYKVAGATISGVRVPEDASNLVVQVKESRVPSDSAETFSELAGITAVVQAGIEHTLQSRLADTQPFWAGNMMRRPVTGALQQFCSSGFGITISGTRYLLTAKHCGSATWGTMTSAVTIGSTAGNLPQYDSQRLLSPSGTKSYIGTWGAGNSQYKIVAGSSINNNGDFVCSSGANSGYHCDIRITCDGSCYWIIDGVTVGAVVEGRQNSGGAASTHGDSGGPVFSVNSDVSRVMARGIVLGAADDSPHVYCDTYMGADDCTVYIAYIAIRPILNAYGATINTG